MILLLKFRDAVTQSMNDPARRGVALHLYLFLLYKQIPLRVSHTSIVQ